MNQPSSADLRKMSPTEKLNHMTIPEPNTGCLLWYGLSDKDGYGKMFTNKKHVRIHRFVYEMHNGPIPEGMIIQHKCDTPSCCNIDHLELGTWLSNMQDKVSKGRLRNQNMHKMICKHGHDISNPNSCYISTTPIGNPRRICKKCHAIRNRKYSLARKSN